MKPYLENKLKFYPNGDIYDEEGMAVMMGWESPLMEKSAEIICSNGGDILNIGYGMGIIDNFIENYPINSHWIIEAHPQIQTQILKKKWLHKPHVKPLFGKWQDICPSLPKFDGIYLDTFGEDLTEFFTNVHYILKPKGIFSFFYNDTHEPVQRVVNELLDILEKNFNIEMATYHMSSVGKLQNESEGLTQYWDPNQIKYKIPICTLK